jgi:hypothetical protein
VPANNWILNPYRQPVYEQGLALVAKLEEAAAQDKQDKKDKSKDKKLAKTAGSETSWNTASVNGPMLSLAVRPAAGKAAITYSLRENGMAKIAIYDMTGKQVAHLAQGMAAAGTHEIVWNATGVSGNYVCVLEANGRNLAKVVQIIR